jgi:phage tail sheath protein FI
MAYNIGLNIVEVDGAGAPALVGASTSVGAFNVITKRGVPSTAVPITSFQKFVERFGGFFAGGLGAYLVKGFFDNGGQRCYVNRVVAAGAAVASLTLQDPGPQNTLRLDAGYRGEADPGSWGNDLYVRPRASLTPGIRLKEIAVATTTGTALVAPIDMQAAAFPALTVRVDGETIPTAIAFQASDFIAPTAATLAEIRDAINRRTTKVIASINVDRIVLTSTGEVAMLRKDWTSLQVTVANASLGFAIMVAPANGTPAARAATGTVLGQVDGLRVGDAVRVTDGTAPNTALVKLMSVNQLTGDVTWAPAIGAIAGYNALGIRVSRVEFDLDIALGGTDADKVVETWTGLSMEVDVPNYAVTRINDAISGSKYIVATNLNSPNAAGGDVPAASATFTRFNQVTDGTPTSNDFIGSSASHSGFNAFDAYDVQLVACERGDTSIVTAALAYCAGRGDCMFVGSVPEGQVEAGTAVAFGQAFQGKKVYGTLYGPWILVADPFGTGDNPIKRIPPTGHIMGVYARIETARGIWKAPAGDEANILGALDVEYRMSDAEHTDLVKNGSVNGVRAVPRAGIIVDASRTLSTDTRWLYVNVRLLFNYVKSTLKQGLRWVRQEPNRDTLWNAVKFNAVVPFLMGLWRQGAFGTGQPSEVFTVICDASNNPPAEVDQGNLKVEVYFYPSKPAETIVIIVGQQPSGAKAAEA